MLVEAELALARQVREKGQWTALRAAAAPGAVLFVPQPVGADRWLKGRADMAPVPGWQAHRAWISCDGTLGVTTGAWQDGQGGQNGQDGKRAKGRAGYFVTAWQRQEDGSYRWTMTQSAPLASPLREPDMLTGEIAACETPPAATVETTPIIGIWRGGNSADGSLYWSSRVDAQCGRIVTVRINRGGRAGFEEVLNRRVDPPRPAASCAA